MAVGHKTKSWVRIHGRVLAAKNPRTRRARCKGGNPLPYEAGY